jgi:hypothetical protein
MVIEFYANWDAVPMLYDYLIDAGGKVWEMKPKPPRTPLEADLRQYILQRVKDSPTRKQRLAVETIVRANWRANVNYFGF